MPSSAPAPAPRRAMVLAAGLGLRMRAARADLPKPLVPVRGRALIDHALDRLAEAGVAEAAVNLHHMGEKIRDALAGRAAPRLTFLAEPTLLETGGGVANALPGLGPDPFYVVNSDALWLNGPSDALHRLARAWDDGRMDALLLLSPVWAAIAYDGRGDFFMDQEGVLRRRREWEVAPFLFAGVQILHPRLFDGAPAGAFSLNRLYDRAIEAGRLYGIAHDGRWFHVGTPDGLALAEAALADAAREAGREALEL